ncbi:hypothetical protein [Kibdelosporangium phytohabitans]|uniref:hypothetical protein n=1 Tax=Kibdelosporangium phytohabitans TaxID=860235 RepID=UPI0012FB095A|nr:hypothetical protein [Kibdelosporangium phytohabitans]MBE1470664.1 hypothetical protein [Kibdelosporangium phytohabitans]
MSRAALAAALGTAALVSGPGVASAGDVQPQYWSTKCDDGRACVSKVSGDTWNIEKCGVSGLNDYFGWAKSHGNAFTIYFENGSAVHVWAWDNKSFPSNVRARQVNVEC